MLSELLTEVIHEITHEPVTFAIEVVQFAILALIIKGVGWGFGQRKGMIPNMLEERRERIGAELERAAERESSVTQAGERVLELEQLTAVEIQDLQNDARLRAKEESARIASEADEAVLLIESETDEALEKERAEVLAAVHDELVDIVTIATRRILDEAFSPTDQREMIQSALMAGLDDLETVALS